MEMIKIESQTALPNELYLEAYFSIYGVNYWALGNYDFNKQEMEMFHIICLDDESVKIGRLQDPYIIGLDILRKMDLKKHFKWELS